MSKRDFILVGAIIFIAAAIYIVNRVVIQKPADTVEVTVDGKQYTTLPLSEDTEITIEGVNGGTNHLSIKAGYAQVVEASCPDKLCVHQKSIHYNGEKIICLPNKVLVEVISGNKSSVDAVAN
jgi:hypothetical protein